MDKINSWFKSVFPKLVKRYIVSKKDFLCNAMNKKLNLPILNEKEELELIEGVFDGMILGLDTLEKKEDAS